MIVADTSALFAIIFDEPEALSFAGIIAGVDRALVAAPTLFELKLVVWKKYGESYLPPVDDWITRIGVEIAPFTPDLVAIATDALVRFGGRPARLNCGDCMAYALAKSLGVPLLFKGGDFAATDVMVAV